MYNLTPVNNLIFANSVLIVFAVGIAVFAVLFIIMVVLFSFSLKDVSKNRTGLLTLLIVSMAIPFTTGQLYQKQGFASKAANSLTISSSEIVKVDNQNYLVNLVTSEPVICSLLFKRYSDNLIFPVLPTQNLEKRTDHAFLVNSGNSGGELTIVINGQNYLLDGRPIILK